MGRITFFLSRRSYEGSEYVWCHWDEHSERYRDTVSAGYVFAWAVYLDSGVERRSVLLLEAGSDVQHVHLAPRHHYPHEGAVIGSSTLNIEAYLAAGGGVYSPNRRRRVDTWRTKVWCWYVPSWIYTGAPQNKLEHPWHILLQGEEENIDAVRQFVSDRRHRGLRFYSERYFKGPISCVSSLSVNSLC